jgi:hypothetical protein
MVKGSRPLRRGLQVRAKIASRCVSDKHLYVSAWGARNWWQLLEMVAIIVRVDLLKDNKAWKYWENRVESKENFDPDTLGPTEPS